MAESMPVKYSGDKTKAHEISGTLADGESVTIQLPPVLASGSAGIGFSISAGTLAVAAGMHEADLVAHADSPFSASNTITWYAPGGIVKLTASGGSIPYRVTA